MLSASRPPGELRGDWRRRTCAVGRARPEARQVVLIDVRREAGEQVAPAIPIGALARYDCPTHPECLQLAHCPGAPMTTVRHRRPGRYSL
jgi:hypothetical protein